MELSRSAGCAIDNNYLKLSGTFIRWQTDFTMKKKSPWQRRPPCKFQRQGRPGCQAFAVAVTGLSSKRFY